MSTSPCVVSRLWPGETVICLGSGPSLTQADVEVCRGQARVIAVNTSYQLAPWADAIYACDERWWQWHKGVPGFPGLKYALETGAARFPGVQVLQNTGIRGLETSPHGLKNGRNSGYQAIGLAYHLGASRILLLGYDMQIGPDHQERWHGAHDPHAKTDPDQFMRRMAMFREVFESIVRPLQNAGVRVVNCTRQTALTVFPQMALEEALAPVPV